MYTWHSKQQILNDVLGQYHLCNSDIATVQQNFRNCLTLTYQPQLFLYIVTTTSEWKILLTARINCIYYRNKSIPIFLYIGLVIILQLFVYWQGFPIVFLQEFIICWHAILVYFARDWLMATECLRACLQSLYGLEKNWLAFYQGIWQQIKHAGGNNHHLLI